ncbi:DUF4097 domain-containing protein [Acerihabitans arboris]|uniref:Adhesin domain-containing protein n=1 Tax=Acerihabitans arboris TaxID=2691583 RepID=A0A845SJP9_9GAMM|nr:DUF4097 domain-containing protein [Acerihabitans arboris]NDL61555.1 hypothetical protein [Acerihabitans arboris]
MNVNINGVSCYFTAASSSINFSNNIGQNLHRVGQCIDSHLKTISGDIKLENCFTPEGNSRVVIKSVSGDITLSGGRLNCDAKSVSGDIKCDDVHLKNVKTVSGDAVLNNGAAVQHVQTTSGAIILQGSSADSLKNCSGKITLKDGSHIKGDVIITGTGTLSIENSSIDNMLVISASHLNIGANATVNHIYLKNVNCISSTFFFDDFPNVDSVRIGDFINMNRVSGIITNTLIIDGVNYGPQNHAINRSSGQNREQPQEKIVTIEDGAVVKSLEFEGDKCTVILEGNARLEGNRNVPGLTVQNA